MTLEQAAKEYREARAHENAMYEALSEAEARAKDLDDKVKAATGRVRQAQVVLDQLALKGDES